MTAKTALEELLQLIQHRALAIASLPSERRQGAYETIHEAWRRASINIGQTDQEATETATKAVEFVRVIVAVIETPDHANRAARPV
jgi:hypothetical protein